MKKALVFGGSGLVGSSLIKELEIDTNYSSIIAFVRKPLGINKGVIKEVVIDFEKPASFQKELNGDEIFICLGTTIKKAGSVKTMEQIDRDLPIEIAELSLAAGIKNIAVVSSIGANANSRNYYLRIKGEMENSIKTLNFDNIVIARPSMLFGDRKEERFGESLGKFLFKGLGFLLLGKLKKYRGIQAQKVAQAMINILSQDLHKTFYESDELEKLSV